MSGIHNHAATNGAENSSAQGSNSGPPSGLRTLVEVVGWRATREPQRKAFTFLQDGELDEVHLTYAELDARASRLAGQLSALGAQGEPVLLVFDPGIDYVVSFFACLYAGAIAVPVYPPDPFRLPRTLPRLQAIVENAGARWLLTTSEMAQKSHLEQISANLVLVDDPTTESSDAVCVPTDENQLALLQYTSGSTGTPRGVTVHHGNLMHNFRAMHAMFDVDNAVVAHWLPPYHDMGLIGCLLLPIYSGRHTVAMSPLAFMQKPVRWLQAIDRFQATTSGAPNFGYELCVRKIKAEQLQGLDLSSWRVAVTGAEPVRHATLTAFCEKFQRAGFRRETFLPAFGMAEATLIVSGEHQAKAPRFETLDLADLEENRVVAARDEQPSRTLVGCGPPAQDVQLQIVEPETRCRLGENQIGEIWLQSPGVGSGYWGDPRRTEEMFRATIANESAENRYLRTGDMGFLRGGELFITGRRKELIILAGRNLYPLDLEQAVQGAHPDLKTDGGAAFSIEIDGEERVVVVQEILRPKKNDLHQVLRVAGQALMAEAGVAPHALVLISAGSLPKTSSGKTRRGECRRLYLEGGLRVLAQWPLPDAAPARESTPPVTEMERGLAPIWEEVLGVEDVGLEDDFFLLGAKSLRIAAMLGRVSEWLKIDVPLDALFNHSTLHAFAQALERLVEHGDADTSTWELPEASQEAPLTDSQLRFWFLERLGQGGNGASSSLHIPLRLTLTGALNVAALRQRLREIVARHDMLRATFDSDSDGAPRQKILGQAELPWSEADFRDDPNGVAGWLQQLEAAPMELGEAPLARAGLARTADDQWQLTLVLHHLIADGWSVGLLLQELGDGDLSPPRGPSYSAYAMWQASQSPADHKQQYWQQRLENAPPVLSLDLSDGALGQTGQSAPNAGLCEGELDAGLVAMVQQFARQHAATPFMVHMAVLQIVLARYAQSTDILIGTVSANRRRPVLEKMLGCFINTLPIRGDLSGNPTFAEMMQRTRERVISDLDHSDYSFERLLQDLQPQREAGRLPLVQALLLLQELPQCPNAVAGAKLTEVDAGQAGLAEFDLALALEPLSDGLSAKLNFRRDRIEPAAAERLLETYVSVLESVLARPNTRLNDVVIPAKSERLELLVERNATDRRIEHPRLVEMLDRVVDGDPTRTAIRFESDVINYRDLHDAANRVADWLQQRGVGPDVPVGIMMKRSPQMVIAMLAVWKAGGAYVPLDLAHPVVRREAIWRDCRPPLVLVDDDCGGVCAPTSEGVELPLGEATSQANLVAWSEVIRQASTEANRAPSHNATGDHLAYVIYTSGTTGEPKGVMVTRKGVANFLQSFARTPGISRDDRVLAHTTISFDISVLELFLPLVAGAEVVLAPCGAAKDPKQLLELIRTHDVNYVQATPSGFRMMRAAGWEATPGMRLLAGGEALSRDLSDDLLSTGAELWNVYGPTETTIWSTFQKMAVSSSTASPAIGRPIDNTQVYVLDDQRRPLPSGVVGELYLGGAGVARGYLRREELTRERFVPDEFAEQPGRMMYRTGDRVRWRADGQLEFRGRTDAQVKVRGHRIELGEVEAALLTHPAVDDAAVICHHDSKESSLTAIVVVKESVEDVAATLRDHLLQHLPAYMAPSAFVNVESLPKSVAGKIDREELARWSLTPTRNAECVPPRTPFESEISAIWIEVLEHDEIGVLDDFFHLGGHSLKATRMISRVENHYGLQLDMAAFFEHPTIEAMANQVRVSLAEQESDLEKMLAELEKMSDEEAEALTNSQLSAGNQRRKE